MIIFNFSFESRNEKEVFPKLRKEVKVKVDIVTSDDIKIYHTWKFQDFTARYIIMKIPGFYKHWILPVEYRLNKYKYLSQD